MLTCTYSSKMIAEVGISCGKAWRSVACPFVDWCKRIWAKGPLCKYNTRYTTQVRLSDQVSLLSLAGAATSIIFVVTNGFSQQTNMCLSRQNTSFVATKVCLQRQNFCRAIIIFVTTKYFCRDKYFRENTCLSRQAYFGRDKRHALSRQSTCLFRQNCVCRNKCFVATKMILMAVPAMRFYGL